MKSGTLLLLEDIQYTRIFGTKRRHQGVPNVQQSIRLVVGPLCGQHHGHGLVDRIK